MPLSFFSWKIPDYYLALSYNDLLSMTRPRSSSTLLYHPDLRMILNWITQLWREQGRELEIRVTSVSKIENRYLFNKILSGFWTWASATQIYRSIFVQIQYKRIQQIILSLYYLGCQRCHSLSTSAMMYFAIHSIQIHFLLPCHMHPHQATLPSSIEMPPCEGVFHSLKYVPR